MKEGRGEGRTLEPIMGSNPNPLFLILQSSRKVRAIELVFAENLQKILTGIFIFYFAKETKSFPIVEHIWKIHKKHIK